MNPHRAEEEDYYDDIPLNQKKPFGSGLKRKRVAFVRASDAELTTTETQPKVSGEAVSDAYLNLVMQKKSGTGSSSGGAPNESGAEISKPDVEICPVCSLPLAHNDDHEEEATDSNLKERRHEASIAHQVSLAHSHPPSAIDRSRMGLAYLESYGWDPDARKGLGVGGQGIHHPLKVKKKEDNLGVGAEIPKEILEKAKEEQEKKPTKVNVKKQLAEEKKKDENLRELFYGSDDLLKYLGKQ